jgi:hypothetical protein
MSFKEVKELRKNGRLDEALIMAQADLEADSSNVWNKRSISWVYYEFAKKNSHIKGYDSFINYFDKIVTLELEESDARMLHENLAIQLGKLVYDIFKVKDFDSEKINTLFEKSKQLIIGKPSDANSFLIKAFLKGNKIWKNIDRVFSHFGFDSFQDKDYLSEEFNGKAILSTVEKYYNAYSKNLIDLSKDGFTSPGLPYNFMMEFLPKLDAIIEKHPEYQFLPYFKAKMLIFLNRRDEVLEAFLPFAKQKKNDF